MFESWRPFDYPVLFFFNSTLAHPWADAFWVQFTQIHKLWWARAFVFPAILLWMLYRYRAQALKPLVMVALTVALSDTIAYRVIKSAVGRPRPFANAEISARVRKVGQAHGSSFPSNHATNSFAAAGILAWYFARRRYWFYAFAGLIAVSRVALGVHYPSDVLIGAWLGLAVAFFVKTMFLSRVSELQMIDAESRRSIESGNWRRRLRQRDSR